MKIAIAAALTLFTLHAQPSDPAAHIAAAKTAAGSDFTALFNIVCPATPTPAPVAVQPRPATPAPAPAPERSTWHAEPMQVFDNLYFVGQTEYSAWAVKTTEGIILLDAIFDYSVEDEVVEGLRTLGMKPEDVKYVIISHGHIDHAGGAWYLQEHFGAHIILSAADWDLLSRDTGRWPKPRKDMVATDGQKLTLGNTTLTLYLTPGHTAGTISTLIPVTDNGTPHLVAEWGGTAFNWVRTPTGYITPERPSKFWFESYVNSSARFRGIVKSAGVDAIISNHTIYDGSKTKLPLLAKRKPGDPNPYVIGNDNVIRYLTVANECAQAGLAGL